MKHKLILISIFVLLGFSLFGQNRIIQFLDKSNNKPIAFVTIFNKTEFYITDETGIANLQVADSINDNWQIRHLSYKNVVYSSKYLMKKDVIYLEPSITELQEVHITAKKKTLIDYYKLINKIIKKYRKNKEPKNLKYAYYLESSSSNKIVEKLMTQINVHYSNNKGFLLIDNYVDFGNFWYNESAPFLNLQTEKLLLGFDIFSKKHISDPYFIPTNSKIKSENYSINILPCPECHQDVKKLQINSLTNDVIITLIVDLKMSQFIEMNIKFKNPENLQFFQLTDNSNIGLNNLSIDYVFDETQDIANIQFKFGIFFNSAEMGVNGFFRKVKNTIDPNHLHTITGAHEPDNIYEQILLQQNSNEEKIKNLFNKKYYNGFEISNRYGLSTANSSLKNFLLEQKLINNNYKIWNEKRLVIDQFNYVVNEDDFYITEFGKVKPLKSDINVFWVFDFEVLSDSIVIKTMPTILNINKSRIFHNHLDSLNIALKMNLAFDLFEIARNDLIDSLENFIINISFNDNIRKFIKSYYDKQYKEINDIINSYFNYEIEISNLVIIDSLILNKLEVDNIEIYFLKELPIIIQQPKYNSILDRIIKKGYQCQKRNCEEKEIYFQKAIRLLRISIFHCDNLLCKDKMRGSFYARLADLYIEQGEYNKACDCISHFKEFWPSGFAASKKRDWSFQFCK